MRLAYLALIAVSGCGGQQAHSKQPAECRETAPLGSRDRMTTPVGAATGPAIDPPVTCGEHPGFGSGSYVRVHGRGDRRFTVVDAEAFGERVLAKLAARGIVQAEVGEGICGNATDRYDDWHMSVSVHDWKDADAAIGLVAEQLDHEGIGDSFGVSIRGWSCPTETATASR